MKLKVVNIRRPTPICSCSSFLETLGGLNNIFPATVEEKKKSPRELAAEAAMTPDTTTVAEIMAARNITANEYSTTPAFTAWSTTTTPTTTTTTTTTTPMPTTTTMVTTTTTPTTTTITMTIPPRSSTGSFTFNGSNYTISGITISTLATTVSRSTTTTAAPTTTMPMVTTEPPISDWMLDPVEDTQTPYQAAAAKLSTMPEDPTYDELFTYIFDDCLLFRKVMKSVEVQYKCPCMTTSDINLMKCDGKGSMQDRLFDAMTYLEHPDDIYEIYIKALNEERRRRDELRRLTDMEVAGAGNTALGTVADTVNDKSEEGDNTERAFQTPRFGMKLQKVNVNATSNSTDGQEGGAGKQSMGTDVGSFSMPASVLAGASDCPNMNTMFLGDSDNPYTFGEEKSSVGKGVMSLGYSCGGEKVQVADSAEPVEMWMERDAHAYKPGLFVLLTDVSNTNAQFNYHPVNLTDKNSTLQVIIRPVDENEAFDVYVQYDIQPNLTHYDFADSVPKADLSHLAHHESLDTLLPEAREDLLYTVTVPSYLTSDNGTYWIGVKLKKGTVSIDDSMSNTSYTLLNLPSGCRFWDETNNTWSSEGCEVGELTSRWKVQCKCTHLTSFGSDAVVPPNTIDFSNVWAKFANLNENAAVFSVIISLLGIYVLLLIFLRYKDKQDLVKWGAMPLEDNLPTDNYHYQLSVYTGVRKNAGTDSRIRFIMSGDESDTGVRRLFDGTRKHFGRSSIFNFVLSVDRSVGNMTFMRIWHDNSGKGKQKSWYLDQIQVTDLQTGEKSIFLCDRWLAVEEDDGMVDRILPVAGIEDLIAFKHLFSSSARKKLANDHLWFSVFSRPTRSNFTRVQRLSCCMSLLFLTMITNAMFFKSEDKQATTTGITLGPLHFTLGQVFISFISTVIVFPPSFLLVLFYRRCRQKKNAVLQTNQQNPKRNQKYRWKNVGNASAIWGDKARKTKMQKLKESVGGIVASYQKNKYEEDPQELVAAEHRPNGEVGSGKKRKKKPWSLPHWCIYIAWVVCFLSVVGSAFFTILFSMEWGKEKANEWLITFVMSFFQNVIVIQPVKVLFMVAIVSCILKKPDLDEEDMDEDLNKVLSPDALSAKKNKDPVSLSHVQMERQMGNNEYAPPDTKALSEARDLRLKEIKMEAVIKEMVIYFFFLFIIFFISYQQRDPRSYQFGQNVRNTFLSGFENIKTVTDYWKWLEGTFLPALFVTKYANGTEIKFWQDKACIGDLAARRVGVARIRQMRVKNETCTLQSEMESIINHCRDAYSWTDDDTKDYLPGWELPTEDQSVELKKAETPWVYQNSVQMKNVPYVGTLATYKGGGYAMLTRRDMCRTKQMIKAAKDKDWLDLNTRAIFLEFTVYNPNVNLFASHILLTEFLTTGGATSRIDIKIFRLLSYIGGWGLIVLLFEVTFALFTVYFLVRCIRMLKKERLKYFNTFWNILEFALLCLAVSCIVFYSFKHILTKVAMSALKDRESDGFVNFQSIALYDETYAFIMSTVVFLATIQFLKLLQFNKNVGMIGDTLILAIKDLKVFSIAFMLYFMSFVITAYLLFGHMMNTYNNIIGAAESMFAFALGSFDFEAMQTAQPMLGPLFFFSYIMVVYIGLMSIFMTIIGDAFTRVKEDTALQSNEYEIVDFMWGKFKGLLGFK
ncbi:hypothetical protein V1264_011307 [Littorina saxatilis]|uniref:Polycystic kidney disease protein 1-like 2 n=1 Tax=Littorina saxatilis TaxID=31220 RepID=A0AAN9BUR6_9CAEN